MPAAGDMLLHVLSARGRTSWETFRRTVDTLAVSHDINLSKPSVALAALLRRLDSLAHSEAVVGSRERHVHVNAPAVVRLPTKEPTAILCGYRAMDTIRHLENAGATLGVSIVVDMHQCDGSSLLPSRIAVRAHQDSELAQFASVVGVAYAEVPAAWSLAHVSASLDEVVARLRFESEAELNWPSADFDVLRFCFRRRERDRPRFCLTRYTDPVTGRTRTYLWRGQSSARVDADWGRFIVLSEAKASVLQFDPAEGVVAIPETVPLPRLLARALTLCSGYVMCSDFSQGYRSAPRASLFRNVTPELAEHVANKLGQTLVHRRLGNH